MIPLLPQMAKDMQIVEPRRDFPKSTEGVQQISHCHEVNPYLYPILAGMPSFRHSTPNHEAQNTSHYFPLYPVLETT